MTGTTTTTKQSKTTKQNNNNNNQQQNKQQKSVQPIRKVLFSASKLKASLSNKKDTIHLITFHKAKQNTFM